MLHRRHDLRQENRMKEIANPLATVTSYAYSGDGLKRSEIKNGGVTTMLWDGSDVLQERS